MFSLDPENGVPIYRQIIQQIEYAVLSERIRPGDKLPTIRSLAVKLKANPNTIAKAYGELEIRGVLETQVGSGTYISDKKPVIEPAPTCIAGRTTILKCAAPAIFTKFLPSCNWPARAR